MGRTRAPGLDTKTRKCVWKRCINIKSTTSDFSSGVKCRQPERVRFCRPSFGIKCATRAWFISESDRSQCRRGTGNRLQKPLRGIDAMSRRWKGIYVPTASHNEIVFKTRQSVRQGERGPHSWGTVRNDSHLDSSDSNSIRAFELDYPTSLMRSTTALRGRCVRLRNRLSRESVNRASGQCF